MEWFCIIGPICFYGFIEAFQSWEGTGELLCTIFTKASKTGNHEHGMYGIPPLSSNQIHEIPVLLNLPLPIFNLLDVWYFSTAFSCCSFSSPCTELPAKDYITGKWCTNDVARGSHRLESLAYLPEDRVFGHRRRSICFDRVVTR